MRSEPSLKRQYSNLSKRAESILEQSARMTMRLHPELIEFVIAMGTWFFIDNKGKYVDDQRAKFVDDFIQEWDHCLNLTGNPMRFTVNGPIVREW